MKILTKNEYVDFEVPVYMTEEQRKRFIQFIKKVFGEACHFEEVEEKTKEMGRRQSNMKKWSSEDILLLFTGKDEKTLAEETNRSEMSIRMARGSLVPEILSWAKKKNKPLPLDIQSVKEFLEDKK